MDLYIDGWRKDNDFRSRWVGRHVNVTHVTARVQIGKLSMSLHTDFETVKWLPTGWMTRVMYNGHFYKVAERKVGPLHTTEMAPLDEMTRTRWTDTALWFYLGRFVYPRMRARGCVRNVRIAADYYGYTLPDTAYTDELFTGDIQCK